MRAEGKVFAISISYEKGIPKTNISRAVLKENWGLEGDAHAGSRRRQVSILANESIEKMRRSGADVAPGDFAENITTQNLDISNLGIGDRLTIGTAEIEVTQIGKECHKHCAIFYTAGDCIMPQEGVFGRVLQGGEIRVGDTIIMYARSQSESTDIIGNLEY